MKRLNGLILWPAYFDSGKKRSEGRRVPVRLSLDSPTTTEILEVCKGLSLKAEVREGKRYPKAWWDDVSPVLIETAGTKSKLLGHIAAKLQEQRKTTMRQSKETDRKSKRR